jgi:predicted nucleotidyltransferase
VRSSVEFANVLRSWAARESSVRRVWIFGSVAKGSENPRDLDVAVELEAEEPQLLWSDHALRWRRELQSQLPIKLDLEWFAPDGSTPTISKGLAEASSLVYERAT